MRLGCKWMRRVIVIQTINRATVRARNEVTVEIDRDLN